MIVFTGFARADALATLVVVVLMAKAGTGLVRAASLVLLEAAPRGFEPEKIGQAMAARDAVVEVHDLHVWEITSGQTALSAHVIVDEDRDCHETRAELAALLAHTHGISHITLQLEHQKSGRLNEHGFAGACAHCAEPHGLTHRSVNNQAHYHESDTGGTDSSSLSHLRG